MRSSFQFGGVSGPEWTVSIHSKGLISFRGKAMLKIYPQFLSEQEADDMYQQLNESCPWITSTVKILGKTLNECRETCLLAEDPTLSYTYSGVKRAVSPINPAAHKFLEKLESSELLSSPSVKVPNLILLNRYSPAQYICEHSDDERNIDQTQSIWSLSLGHTRILVIREKRAKFNQLNRGQEKRKKRTWRMEIPMPHGTLLEFCPGMQEWFSHEVIKPRKKMKEDVALKNHAKFSYRINLTARVFNSESQPPQDINQPQSLKSR